MEDDGEDDGEEEDVLCFKYFTFRCIFSLWVIPNVQILGALSSERNLMMATVVWWAVCYSPADIVYSIATNKVSAMMPEPCKGFVSKSGQRESQREPERISLVLVVNWSG